MIEVTCRSLGDIRWPGGERRREHRRAQFKTGWVATLNMLRYELAQLGAEGVELFVDVLPTEIRRDGWPRANALPHSPAVILRVARSDDSDGLQFWTDRFDHWRDNVRAIALGLEALRKMRRYGLGEGGEQYHGFKELPETASASTDGLPVDVHDARSILASFTTFAAIELRDREKAKSAYREAARKTHPDVASGTEHAEFWPHVQAAGRILGVGA